MNRTQDTLSCHGAHSISIHQLFVYVLEPPSGAPKGVSRPEVWAGKLAFRSGEGVAGAERHLKRKIRKEYYWNH